MSANISARRRSTPLLFLGPMSLKWELPGISGMSNNFNQRLRLCHQRGLDAMTRDVQYCLNRFRELFCKIKLLISYDSIYNRRFRFLGMRRLCHPSKARKKSYARSSQNDRKPTSENTRATEVEEIIDSSFQRLEISELPSDDIGYMKWLTTSPVTTRRRKPIRDPVDHISLDFHPADARVWPT